MGIIYNLSTELAWTANEIENVKIVLKDQQN